MQGRWARGTVSAVPRPLCSSQGHRSRAAGQYPTLEAAPRNARTEGTETRGEEPSLQLQSRRAWAEDQGAGRWGSPRAPSNPPCGPRPHGPQTLSPWGQDCNR